MIPQLRGLVGSQVQILTWLTILSGRQLVSATSGRSDPINDPIPGTDGLRK